jgi:conjugal transfer pilin signal peptidase TrbI
MKRQLVELKNSYWEQSKGIVMLMLVVAAFTLYFMSRYTFAFNGAVSDCLKTKIFLVDTWEKDVTRGDLAAFYMEKPNKLFKTGFKWIKRVAAQEGDVVDVTYDNLIVNGTDKHDINLWYTLSKLDMQMSQITAQVTVDPNNFFMVGETSTSYDSRYWGTVEKQHIIGRAYAIF